jgi:hypothetical protein
MMFGDLARSLDGARWFADAGLIPDPWQARAIRSNSKRKIWNVHRQGGKSEVAALSALRQAVSYPESLTLLISPAQRQSAELLRRVVGLRDRIPGLPKPVSVAAHKLEFARGEGGRIISLPSSETTIRGYAAVDLLILDEASRIPDATIAAVRPMVAVSGGSIVALSTPAGRRGWYFETWHHGGDLWEREQVPVTECKRIGQDFLDEEMQALGPLLYRQEYLCSFEDDAQQLFTTDLIESSLCPDVQPLWPWS